MFMMVDYVREMTEEILQVWRLKLHDATQMFMMVDYVREMTVKKSCKYGD